MSFTVAAKTMKDSHAIPFFLNKTLRDFRLSMLEKTKEELDFIVLSKLSSGMHMSEHARKDLRGIGLYCPVKIKLRHAHV